MSDKKKLNLGHFTWLVNGINPEALEQVRVRPVPSKWMEVVDELVEFKSCYNNCYHVLTMLQLADMFEIHDLAYCLVAADPVGGLLVEHAIVRVNGRYYDPTWQKFLRRDDALSSDYRVIAAFDMVELVEWIEKSDMHPPMVEFLCEHQHPIIDLDLAKRARACMSSGNFCNAVMELCK